MQKLRSIQVLRGIAATAVVVHHAYRHVNPNTHARIGAAGVDLFFVISGFIMATVAARRKPAEFLLDRFWRIFPLWWVAVLPVLMVMRPTWSITFTSLTLWPFVDGHYQTPVLLQGWTLSFELLFYVAFALALATRAIVPLAMFACAFGSSFFVRSDALAFAGSPMIVEFLFGVIIAMLPMRRQFALPLAVAALVTLAVAPVEYYAEPFGIGALERLAWWGLPAAAIVYSARSLEALFDDQAFALPLLLLGDASYSIYLFHQFVVGIGPWPVGIALSLLLGISAHFALERPILRIKARFHQNAATQI